MNVTNAALLAALAGPWPQYVQDNLIAHAGDGRQRWATVARPSSQVLCVRPMSASTSSGHNRYKCLPPLGADIVAKVPNCPASIFLL
jgi:hypothetical protein